MVGNQLEGGPHWLSNHNLSRRSCPAQVRTYRRPRCRHRLIRFPRPAYHLKRRGLRREAADRPLRGAPQEVATQGSVQASEMLEHLETDRTWPALSISTASPKQS